MITTTLILALFMQVSPVLNFTMTSLDGKPVNLSKYQGQVVLVVNVASECGYTPQYEGLQELHRKYAARGLRVLGFPSNDFGAQEPGTNAEIAEFCKKNYGVGFDMFSKIVVSGPGKAPFFKYLTAKESNPKFAGGRMEFREVPHRTKWSDYPSFCVGCRTTFR